MSCVPGSQSLGKSGTAGCCPQTHRDSVGASRPTGTGACRSALREASPPLSLVLRLPFLLYFLPESPCRAGASQGLDFSLIKPGRCEYRSQRFHKLMMHIYTVTRNCSAQARAPFHV